MRKLLVVLLLLLVVVGAAGQTRPSYLQITDKPVFDVRDFGATKGDTTDDYEAIQAAINAAKAAGGGVISLPGPGTYHTSKTIVVPRGYANLVIDGGSLGTRLKTLIATSAIELRGTFPWAGNYDVRCIRASIRNLTIIGADYGQAPWDGVGIHLNQVGEINVESVVVRGFSRGIQLDGSEVTFDKIILYLNTVGLYVDRDCDGIFSAYGSIFAGNYEQDVFLYSMRSANFYYSTFSVGGKDFPGVEVGGDVTNTAEILNFNGCFFETSPSSSNRYNNPIVKIAGNLNILNFDASHFGDPSASGSRDFIVVASGARRISITNSKYSMVPSYNGENLYGITIKNTQVGALQLNFDRNNEYTQWLRVRDERPDFHLSEYGESFGHIVNKNTSFLKGIAEWSGVLGSSYFSVASSSLFVATGGVCITEVATLTAHYAEYYPENRLMLADDVLVIDHIVKAVSSYSATLALVPKMIHTETGTITTLPFTPREVQRCGDYFRVITMVVVPKEYSLYSIRFGSSTSLDARELHYMALYSRSLPPDTFMRWYYNTPPGDYGKWIKGDRVWKSGTYVSLATDTSYIYNGTTWDALP